MNWVDAVIVVVIVLSAGVGFIRGFGREIFGLAAWVVAFYLAFHFSPNLSAWMTGWISARTPRLVLAFAIIFVLVVILGAIINVALGRLINNSGLAGTDRMLGVGFGVLRGIALLVMLVLLAGVTSIPRDTWWQDSVLMHHLETGALAVRPYLPSDLARSVSYPDRSSVQSTHSAST